MKKPKRVILALYGVCAVSWSIRVLVGVMSREYADSFGMFILNVIIALIWIAAFVGWLLKYDSGKDE